MNQREELQHRHCRQAFASFLVAFAVFSAVAHGDLLRIATYNTFNNPDDDTEDVWFTTIFEAIGNESVGGVAKRLDILAVAETDAGSSARLVSVLNSLYGVSTYNVVTSSPDPFDRTAVVYDSSTVTLLGSTELTAGLTHHIMRAEFRPAATGGTADFYVYAIHLKSGAEASDKTTRAAEMELLRADADALGEGTNIIYAGDFNMDGSSEGAWSSMTAAGIGQGFDPADAPGEWRDNDAFLSLHTHNARGNMDNRLDLQFVSGELLDDVGLDYIDGSYRVFGNNGTHLLGDAIDTGTGASPVVLSALMDASDHLPVVADFVVPEPGTLLLLTAGGVVFVTRQRRASSLRCPGDSRRQNVI